MAISRERFPSISELQLPYFFTKERPFETTGKKQPRLSARQETKADDADQCQSLELKFSKVTVEEDPKKTIQEKEECQNIFWSQSLEELSNQARKFAPHLMALERIQEKMRMFLQEHARKNCTLAGEEMSEQDLKIFRLIAMRAFRDKKLFTLNQVLRFSFFHEILLRRIRYIASEELEPLREAIIETEEMTQTFQQRFLRDHKWTLDTQLTHDFLYAKLLEGTKKVEKLFEESVFFQGQLPIEDMIVYMTAESRICYALGLEIDFLDKLKLYNDELTSHLSLEEWILNYLNNNYEDIEDEDLKKDLSKDLLIKLGFRANSEAINTILTRSTMWSGHVEATELVTRFVQDELKYHPVFAQELYLFPYTDQAYTRSEVQFSDQIISIMCMNIASVEDSEELYEQYISKHIDELRDEDSVVLFHGTDRCSAIDMLNLGIDVNLGMPGRDFSDGCGFYMTNDYKHSEKWASSLTRKPAVLVFKVPKTFLEKSSSLDLSEKEKKTDWLQIVTECRSGTPSRKLCNKLKAYDVIRGPISKPSDDPNRPFEPREDSHQVCVLDEDCAEEIQQFLHTVLFYE